MKLVIFDCDGTLVDSQNTIVSAMAHAFAAEGLTGPTRAQVLSVVGLSLPQAFERLAAEHDAHRRGQLAEHYKGAFAHARAQPAHADPLFDGAADAVSHLAGRDDILLGIATGKSRRGVDRLLERLDWRGHFVTIQTADDNPSKPHPAMVLRACAEAGVDVHDAVMIGDTSFDMAMAVDAGAGAIGVTWGYHPVQEITAAGAHEIVERFEQLVPAIDAMFARRGLSGERI